MTMKPENTPWTWLSLKESLFLIYTLTHSTMRIPLLITLVNIMKYFVYICVSSTYTDMYMTLCVHPIIIQTFIFNISVVINRFYFLWMFQRYVFECFLYCRHSIDACETSSWIRKVCFIWISHFCDSAAKDCELPGRVHLSQSSRSRH